ncbi:Ent-kaurene synthase chloroplastic [Euphorbia peplus]|uniref:Diterpene synthase class I n=1 Tax=Euphorbia peplus TaxID=38846 RepID=A0A0M4M9R4_EUPPE|nr:diterpene synthase class I [Euphorbia peplus]WCJ40673.1 Ent-kaurene synthase chloroplastic [Euphorbia peplus]
MQVSLSLTTGSEPCITRIHAPSDAPLKQRNNEREKGTLELNGKVSLKKMGEMLRTIENVPIVGSTSSYDTAWVGMVPCSSNSSKPLFPESLKWIMENQNPEGNWAVDHAHHPLLLKDSLSSTLACVLALHKWNLAPQLVHSGLDFIGSNLWAAMDFRQRSPLGFDVIFPGMIHQAIDLGINLPFNNSSIENMLTNPLLDIQSFEAGKTSHIAYFAEGLGSRLKDWEQLLQYQTSNGSLFNSPSTTAAAAIHLRDEKCLNYLHSLTKQFDNGAVPTLYPLDARTRISIIDSLEKFGIHSHFIQEMTILLDQIYSFWKEGNEEIFKDPGCCATAFRLLRKHGYDVSSDSLAEFEKKEIFYHSSAASAHEIDTKSILELFRASQMKILQNEPILDRIYDWTSIFLRDQLVKGLIENKSLYEEVNFALGHPFANLDRLEARSYIDNYDPYDVPLLKTSYRSSNIDNKDLWTIAFQDFNKCQALHRVELDYLEKWVKEYKLDTLKWARQKTEYALFTIGAILSEPEYADARISWSQNTVFVTIVDDFFDYGGSLDECRNLINLMHKWDDHLTVGFLSEKVEIVFYSMYGTLNDLAAKAEVRQGRCVRSHLVNLWIWVMENMLKEREWADYNLVPTFYEYVAAGHITIGLGPVLLIALYFMGYPLSEDVVQSQEYKGVYLNVSIIARLLNDRVTVKRESAQGKLNGVSLFVEHGRGAVDEETSMKEVERLVESHKRELLRLIVQKTEGSVVPQSCKDLAWRVSKVLHLLYMDDDGFTCPVKMLNATNAIVNEPLLLTS